MAKYTITDSHSLTATSPFSAKILGALKLQVTKGEATVVVAINQNYRSARQLHVVKGQGAELFKLLMGASKGTPVDVEIEVAE